MDNTRSNLLPATDEQLLARHLAGDQHAFTGLVQRHERELQKFLRRFVGDAVAADDLFQEAFLQVHKSAGAFDLQKRFRPWLFTIAANKARDLLRSRRRRRVASLDTPVDPSGVVSLLDTLPSGSAAPTDAVETRELRRRVLAIVARMPKNQRDMLKLAYLDQLPQKQISQDLGVPLGTIKSRLHVATRTFASAWNAETNKDEAPRRQPLFLEIPGVDPHQN
ncbi:MAG: sigma-70 family RNA polymerase sigma factor [Tepidisphaeraceae bacterium]